MHTRNMSFWLMSAVLASTLAGCGGADDDDMDPGAPGGMTAGDTFAITSSNRLVSFNRSTPTVRTAVAVTGLQASENILGIDLRAGGTPAGQLYALGSTGRVYTVNTGTGAATMKTMLVADNADTTSPFTALDGTTFGVDVNTVPDRLRVVSNTGQDLRINMDTGATITDGALTLAAVAVSGVTEVAYTNNFAIACRTTLYYLDTTADRLLSTSDPNNGILTAVGALGVDASAMTGFDITTGTDGSNTAVASLTVGGASTAYTINLTTGAATSVGAITGLNAGETIRGIALPAPATAPTQAQGELLALTETNKLLTFNNGSPQKSCTTATVSGLQTNESVLGIDQRPSDSKLYALGSTGRVYTVDPATGAAALKSTLIADTADTTDGNAPFTALDGTDFGVDVNPVPDRLRVVSNTGQNLRINMDTGATITDLALNPAGSSVTSAAYTNSFVGAGATTLYVLDATNDRLMIQGQPSGSPNKGDLQAVGTLAITGDVGPVGAFDINGRSGAAFAALNVAAAATSDLYSINLATGAATRVNTIAGGERIRGLTYVAAPVATVLGVTSDNQLVSFKVTTPGTFDTSVAITGLQGGEKVHGFDSRPANGKFYVVTDAGRLYTIDTTTGAATPGMSLVADNADTTAPFAMLTGTNYGVDFNPMADRLRVTSDTEQNLRINVDTGATTTDTALLRGPFTVTAAAYTAPTVPTPPATPTTVLYVIDTTNDQLMIQTPPNDGTLKTAGALGIDASGVNGFEIVGPDTAIAALTVGTAAPALYTISLTTGAATAAGTIVLAQTTDQVTGLFALPSAVTPAVNSTVFAIVNGTSLVSFARNAPGTVSAALAITGLQANETILGADFRLANNTLYALGSTARIYTLNTATGAATLVAALAADPMDATAPFTALSGTNFGVDVNPVADRLRVVSDTGQNLRIVMDTGITITDGNLNVPAPDVTASAYTRNQAGATATTLFDLDVTNLALYRQAPPNDGILLTIGKLDPALTFVAGGSFDIAGGDDGLALVALQPTGATQSTLYRINLKTGALTPVGAIGPATATVLNGLAIKLQ
jgi:hypothetical protein